MWPYSCSVNANEWGTFNHSLVPTVFHNELKIFHYYKWKKRAHFTVELWAVCSFPQSIPTTLPLTHTHRYTHKHTDNISIWGAEMQQHGLFVFKAWKWDPITKRHILKPSDNWCTWNWPLVITSRKNCFIVCIWCENMVSTGVNHFGIMQECLC